MQIHTLQASNPNSIHRIIRVQDVKSYASLARSLPQWAYRRKLLQNQPQSSQQDIVPVVLVIGDYDAIAINPEDGRVVLASEIDTTTCLLKGQIQDVFNPQANNPSYAAIQSNSQQPNRRLTESSTKGAPTQAPTTADGLLHALRSVTSSQTESINTDACSSDVLVVATQASTVTVLIKINALVSSLPANALTVANGQVLPPVYDGTCAVPPCPTVDGPWSVFQVVVQLGPPNTLTNISVAYDAMQPALINGNGKATAASNMIIASQDTEGPKVVLNIRHIALCIIIHCYHFTHPPFCPCDAA